MSRMRRLWVAFAVALLSDPDEGWHGRRHGESPADRMLDEALARRGHPPVEWEAVR